MLGSGESRRSSKTSGFGSSGSGLEVSVSDDSLSLPIPASFPGSTGIIAIERPDGPVIMGEVGHFRRCRICSNPIW